MAGASRARRLVFWLAVLVGGWALAIVLAEPIYELLTSLGWSRRGGYAKVLRRLLLVPPVVVFLGALKPWRAGGLKTYGLTRGSGRAAAKAALATFAVALAILGLHFAAGWLRFEETMRWGEVARRLVMRSGGALIVGVLEEWLFRGWMFRRFGGSTRAFRAALATALVFAALHAFKPAGIDVEAGGGPAGALAAVGDWLGRLVDPADFGWSFAGLFFLSLLLTATYLRSGSLWVPIAVHATGSFVIHTYGALTERTVGRTWAGSKWLYDGWPAWVVMAGLAFALWPRNTGPRNTGPRTAGPRDEEPRGAGPRPVPERVRS